MRRPPPLCFLIVAAAILAATRAVAGTATLTEEVVRIPVTVEDLHRDRRTMNMPVTVFRPAGKGPFPVAVVSHGRWSEYRWRSGNGTFSEDRYTVGPHRYRMRGLAEYLAGHGFLVLVPTRIGYGETAGRYDPELIDCTQGLFRFALESSAAQVLAALEYGRRRPDAKPDGAVLLGESAGGMATVVAAASNPTGVIGAINLAGGIDGRRDNHGVPCNPGATRRVFDLLGKSARVRMLWLYAENDQLFGPEYTRTWAKAYRAGGAPIDFHLLPAFGDDGHATMFSRTDVWPLMDRFLADPGRKPR